MEIVFLGTGGGRFNLVRQLRLTGGFRINGPLAVHVDPGPGALFASMRFGQDASKLDLIVVTHNHIDHVNDAGLLVEAFSRYGEKHGFFIGSRSVIEGDENGDRGISRYHLGSLEKYWVAEAGKKIEAEMRGEKISLLPTRVKHEDGTGFGFVLEMGGARVGYTSDTEYFEGIGRQYAGCDVLVANSLKPKEDGIPGHLDTDATIKLVSEAGPKLAIMTHLGTSMLKAGPEREAARVERESGVRTVAASDGMEVGVERQEITKGAGERHKKL